MRCPLDVDPPCAMFPEGHVHLVRSSIATVYTATDWRGAQEEMCMRINYAGALGYNNYY